MAEYEQIMKALRNAHAAGDTQAATRLAAMAKAARQPAEQPAQRNPDGTYGQPPEGFFMNPETGQMTSQELMQNNEPAERPGFLDRMTSMARATVGDISAGFQGVNPVAVGQQSPIGVLRPSYPGSEEMVVDVDGVPQPVSDFSPQNYVTQINPENGQTYVYARTPDIEESRLASAGRVLSYGITSGPQTAVKAARQPSVTETARSIGVEPSLGMRGSAGARAAGALESLIPSGGVINKDAQRAGMELGEAATRTARSVSPASTAGDAGRALVEGANYFADRTKNAGNYLFERVGRYIPKGQQVEPQGTKALLTEMAEGFENAPSIARDMQTNRYADYLADVSGKLSWGDLGKFRSELLKAQRGETSPFSSIPEPDRKRLIAAITDDMGAIAETVSPEARQAWNTAREFWRKRSETIDGALNQIFKAEKSGADEKAFFDTFRLTGDTASANVSKLGKIKSSMRPEDWGQVVSTVIDRMGKATPGAQDAGGELFSGATFLTNWNKMTPQAKSILFQGKGVPEGLRSSLDKLAKVSEAAKDAGAQVNRSRSGSVGANITGGAALMFAEPTTQALMLVTPYVSAKALTNKRVVDALTFLGRTGNPRRLIEIAARDDGLGREIATALRLSGIESQSRQPAPAMQ